LKGVSKVRRGWSGFMETDTVTYDRSMISVREMERALKEAGTYRKTIGGK
jgi:hypothetical protein